SNTNCPASNSTSCSSTCRVALGEEPGNLVPVPSLSCKALSSSTACQFNPAHFLTPPNPPISGERLGFWTTPQGICAERTRLDGMRGAVTVCVEGRRRL